MGCDALYDARLAIPGKDVVLFDLATWKNGLSFKKIDFSDSGIPVIKIAELNNGIGSSTSFTRGVYSSDVKLQRGDFLFSWSGNPETSIDIFRFELKEGWLNQHIFKTTPNSSLVTRDYFFYLMKWLKPVFKSIASNKQTTGLGHITISDLKKIKVTVPAKDLQNKVAAILTAIDNKISLNAKLNGYLEELVDALFCEMVLGAVDSSKTVSFSSFLEERKEKCPSRTNAEYSVTDTGIHPRSLKFRKNLSATSSKNKIARKGDLVFGISRRILNWGLFDAEIGEVSSAYRVYSISGVPPEYVARYIARYQCAFTDIIKPSSREGQGIMPDALMAKKLPKLNSFAWEKYLDTVAPIKALASITRTETAALFESRDSILPKLMSGEIDVSKIDLAKLNSHLA